MVIDPKFLPLFSVDSHKMKMVLSKLEKILYTNKRFKSYKKEFLITYIMIMNFVKANI